MGFEAGEILEGKVRSITNYGAFISLPDGKSGLVHISEVSNTYVNDIHDHLTQGQSVRVKVLSAEEGKINLSIKRAAAVDAPAPKAQARPAYSAPKGPLSFEDKIKQFMSDSNSNLSSNKFYSDHKTKTRKR